MLHISMWRPDGSSAACEECHASFSVLRRRHHCRRCGGLFCHTCTSQQVWLASPRPEVSGTSSCAMDAYQGEDSFLRDREAMLGTCSPVVKNAQEFPVSAHSSFPGSCAGTLSTHGDGHYATENSGCADTLLSTGGHARSVGDQGPETARNVRAVAGSEVLDRRRCARSPSLTPAACGNRSFPWQASPAAHPHGTQTHYPSLGLPNQLHTGASTPGRVRHAPKVPGKLWRMYAVRASRGNDGVKHYLCRVCRVCYRSLLERRQAFPYHVPVHADAAVTQTGTTCLTTPPGQAQLGSRHHSYSGLHAKTKCPTWGSTFLSRASSEINGISPDLVLGGHGASVPEADTSCFQKMRKPLLSVTDPGDIERLACFGQKDRKVLVILIDERGKIFSNLLQDGHTARVACGTNTTEDRGSFSSCNTLTSDSPTAMGSRSVCCQSIPVGPSPDRVKTCATHDNCFTARAGGGIPLFHPDCVSDRDQYCQATLSYLFDGLPQDEGTSSYSALHGSMVDRIGTRLECHSSRGENSSSAPQGDAMARSMLELSTTSDVMSAFLHRPRRRVKLEVPFICTSEAGKGDTPHSAYHPHGEIYANMEIHGFATGQRFVTPVSYNGMSALNGFCVPGTSDAQKMLEREITKMSICAPGYVFILLRGAVDDDCAFHEYREHQAAATGEASGDAHTMVHHPSPSCSSSSRREGNFPARPQVATSTQAEENLRPPHLANALFSGQQFYQLYDHIRTCGGGMPPIVVADVACRHVMEQMKRQQDMQYTTGTGSSYAAHLTGVPSLSQRSSLMRNEIATPPPSSSPSPAGAATILAMRSLQHVTRQLGVTYLSESYADSTVSPLSRKETTGRLNVSGSVVDDFLKTTLEQVAALSILRDINAASQ